MTRRRGPKHSRGYTVIEVMIALTLLAVGTSGIIAMQKVTAIANRDAKTLVIATQVARTWVERLRADATQWNHPSAMSAEERSGRHPLAQDGQRACGFAPPTTWPAPPPPTLSATTYATPISPNAIFCTNVRLTWLYGPAPTSAPALPHPRRGPRVLAARRRRRAASKPARRSAIPGIDISKVSPSLERYHFVYLTSALAQNMAR